MEFHGSIISHKKFFQILEIEDPNQKKDKPQRNSDCKKYRKLSNKVSEKSSNSDSKDWMEDP